MADFSIEEFENSSQENGVRYWEAHEFMKRLGYGTWAACLNVITKAMGSCARLGVDPTETFIASTIIQDGKTLKSYKLTRFACFLISMHGDSKKPEVMKVRAVLAVIADQVFENQIREQDLDRIEAREDLKMAERLMDGVAFKSGLESKNFGIFKDAGFRGMYNMSLRDLMFHKGIPREEKIYDFMGLSELAGNLFRVTLTKTRVETTGIRGLEGLKRTAQNVGYEVRKVMLKDGIAPESLPIEEHISTVTKRLKTTAQRMKKLDTIKVKRLKPPAQP